MPPSVTCVLGTTRKVCQLTGQYDRALRQPAFNETASQCGLVGTDLGFSFVHQGVLWFLFGDTLPDPNAGDSVAWTDDELPEPGVHLNFVKRSDGRFTSPVINTGISTEAFEVPVAGFSAGEEMYVFYTTDHFREDGQDLMGRSVLCRADGDPTNLDYLYDVSILNEGGKFINVSPVVVPNGTVSGLPVDGDVLLVWGSGRYRQSDPYLACVPLDNVEDRSQWRYFTGREAGVGQVHWSGSEADAVALFGHPQIGELSVTWNAPLGLWLMLYNAGAPRGINFRVAAGPWGPWTLEQLVFDPTTAYGQFMHQSWDASTAGQVGTDQLYDPGRGTVWGGEYGPYVIDRYTQGVGKQCCAIYFTMSVWNPYNAMLMTTHLERGADVGEALASACLIQSSFGVEGRNFELAVAAAGGGLANLTRNGDVTPPLWWNAQLAGSESGELHAAALELGAVSMIQSSVSPTGKLVVAAVYGQKVVSWWRDPTPPWSWHGPYPVIACDGAGGETRDALTGTSGNPVLIQSRDGADANNFELMVPDLKQGIRHLYLDNGSGFPYPPDWQSAPTFGEAIGRVDAIAMIESTFGTPGNLKVIARSGYQLWALFRDETLAWQGPYAVVADGIEVVGTTGIPCLIQGTYGARRRNFELAVPLAAGGIGMYWRDNDSSNPADWLWHGPSIVDEMGAFSGVSLIESSYGGSPGNLKIVGFRSDELVHLWRDSQTLAWSGPYPIPWDY